MFFRHFVLELQLGRMFRISGAMMSSCQGTGDSRLASRSKRTLFPRDKGELSFQSGTCSSLRNLHVLAPFCASPPAISMALDITSPQVGPLPPSNNSSTSLYFDAMPSLSSIFNGPRGQSRSSSPERGIKSTISPPIPTDPAQNPKPILLNGDTNIGDGGDDKNTLRAGGSAYGDGTLTSEPLQQSPPPVKSRGLVGVEMSRNGSESGFDVSSPGSTARRRSLSRSEEHGGNTDDASLRSLPVVHTNAVHEGGEVGSNNPSQVDVSRKVSLGRTPSKLVKRRSTKGKQTEYLVNGSGTTRRSASRTSQRSFRSNRGPVFDMVTAPPNATISNAGGAFGGGAVMAAPENEIEDELQSGFHERAATAQSALTDKQVIKIQKEELAVSKKISRIVESEGKSEKNSLKAAIGELKGIQRMQRVAVKEEGTTHASHIKSLQKYHEADIVVIRARAELEKVEADIAARVAKFQAELNKLRVKAQAKVDHAIAEAEKAKADVKARENHREASRRYSEQMTDWVRGKRKEVEVLRGWMAVDNRERAVKLNELKNGRARSVS